MVALWWQSLVAMNKVLALKFFNKILCHQSRVIDVDDVHFIDQTVKFFKAALNKFDYILKIS